MYGVILSILLASGVHETTHSCPDLVCVAYMMTAAHDSPGLARIRVMRGKVKLLPSGYTIFPPLLDEQYQ